MKYWKFQNITENTIFLHLYLLEIILQKQIMVFAVLVYVQFNLPTQLPITDPIPDPCPAGDWRLKFRG